MNSLKLLPRQARPRTACGSAPWSIEQRRTRQPAASSTPTEKYSATPDQFAAQAYDAMHIAAEAMKKVKLSGELAKDREALRAALPNVKWDGATGPFAFRRVTDKAGKPAGYDAKQEAIVSTTRGKNYEIEK